jgi:hypothetical protein
MDKIKLSNFTVIIPVPDILYCIVAEKIDEFSMAANPPNCVGRIREFCYFILIVSRLVVSLRNTSPQLT